MDILSKRQVGIPISLFGYIFFLRLVYTLRKESVRHIGVMLTWGKEKVE